LSFLPGSISLDGEDIKNLDATWLRTLRKKVDIDSRTYHYGKDLIDTLLL
jgi:hypothetical protein